MAFSEATTEPVRRSQIARYACAVDDFNGMHVDEDFARQAGMPSVIAHGPLTLALALDAIVAQLGPDAFREMEARLTAPVFPGDALTVVPADGGAEVRKADGTVAAKLTLRLDGS
jgi:acyl dehydratase